jgi:predicted transcriptional regulator
MEKSLTGSFGHSIDATTKVVYTTDESLYQYVEENRAMGQADAEKAVFSQVNGLIGIMEKIEKWLVVKKDAAYAQYYVLKAADYIARIEVCSRNLVPTREAILQAGELNPSLIEKFYLRPMSGPMTEKEIYAILKEMDAYIKTHIDAVMNVAKDFFGDGEIKTGTHISTHFRMDMHMLHPILDFLCDNGHLEKISQTIRLTPKGRMAVEEIAFIMQE